MATMTTSREGLSIREVFLKELQDIENKTGKRCQLARNLIGQEDGYDRGGTIGEAEGCNSRGINHSAKVGGSSVDNRHYDKSSQISIDCPDEKQNNPRAKTTNIGTTHQVLHDGGGKILRLCYDVGQYEAKEVVVKIIGNRLQVNAKHQEKDAGKCIFREYKRDFHLPAGIDKSKIKATMTEGKILQVDCYLDIEKPRCTRVKFADGI